MSKDGVNRTEKSVDLKLEVVVIGVSDVDRAKAFYEKLGWRLDGDFTHGDGFRALQFTPPNSEASVIFGKGVTATKPGSLDSLVLAVRDVGAARADLLARGIAVSEVFHYTGGPFNNSVDNPREGGPDPEKRPYYSFASFEDPDGNGWLLQEIAVRPVSRDWAAGPEEVAALAALLHETEQHHGAYERTHAAHHWWDWYAPYISARRRGSTPEEAAEVANRSMDEVHHVAASGSSS